MNIGLFSFVTDYSMPITDLAREADEASGKPDDDEVFVRNDPTETPRPPDATGEGLGESVGTELIPADADPTRVRPQDAVSAIYKPGSANMPYRSGDSGQHQGLPSASHPKDSSASSTIPKLPRSIPTC